MDLDKPLDDMIPKRGGGRGRGGRGGGADRPRRSEGRRDSAPYARPPPRSTEDKWVHDQAPGRRLRGDREPREGSLDVPVSNSPRIEVSGLHYEVTTDDLQTIFSQAGTIVQGPTIVYDRSGRSTGRATIEYTSAAQAKVAINNFDGAMTKGQTIAIKLLPPPRKAKEASSSLLSRIGAGSLQDRIGGERPQRGEREPRRGGRSDDRERQDSRGGARGGRGRGGAARPARRKPANADDLDRELDGFMDKSGDVAMA